MITPGPEVTFDTSPCITLALESRPETLTLVRAMLSGVAELLQIDPELLDDLKTAVSEACNNSVLHAYPGGSGPLRVELFVLPDALAARIVDRGVGLPSGAAPVPTQTGVGIPVIRALAGHAEFRPVPGGGTEVLMQFAARRGGELLFTPPGAPVFDDDLSHDFSGDAVATISPVEMLGAVLGRLARTLAATARFSLDRFSDVYLVTDAVAAFVRDEASGGRVVFSLAANPQRLELSIGPLRAGSGDRVKGETGGGSRSAELAVLSDGLHVTPAGGEHEVLQVVMLDRHD